MNKFVCLYKTERRINRTVKCLAQFTQDNTAGNLCLLLNVQDTGKMLRAKSSRIKLTNEQFTETVTTLKFHKLLNKNA